MSEEQKHVEDAGDAPSTVQGLNSAPFGVNISFPESVVIKMVDASALDDYENLLFFSAFFFSAFVGFVIATIQARDTTPWAIMSIVLAAAAGGSLRWAWRKRATMKARSKEFKVKMSGIEEVKAAPTSNA